MDYQLVGHSVDLDRAHRETPGASTATALVDSDRLRKSRGAFFTPPGLARYLVDWAIRSPNDTVFEPSCGEASFLLAAAERLKTIGANPASLRDQLHGIEIFDASAKNAGTILRDGGFDAQISVGDFFDHRPASAYDAVVGNPPFVRYQHFSGSARVRALEAALAQGVRLSGLANAWAAFVVKAALHVKPTGRLALVLPAELLTVNYAQEVRRFLLRRFGRVRLIMFEDRVFPGVLEEVVLLLAEGSGGAEFFDMHQTRDTSSLSSVDVADWTSHAPRGDEKWTPALVGTAAIEAYRQIVDERFESLGKWGNVYLGSVTGNNRFFSLTVPEAKARGLSDGDVIRISPPGTRHLHGLTFTKSAWTQLSKTGARCLLLYPKGTPSDAAQRYISEAEAAGVSKAYKCRMRKPWWRVPLVSTPDLFLTYMNHDRPRLISNAGCVQILNSVYGITLARDRKQLGCEGLPLASLNSVTLLGSEIVGRAYGGGLLKMEPREADTLPVPSLERIKFAEDELKALKPQVARALQNGNLADAVEAVDEVLLRGVKASEMKALRLAREMLFQRRRSRNRSAKR